MYYPSPLRLSPFYEILIIIDSPSRTQTGNKTEKKSRRKPLTNKYNVTISASYTYAAEHNPKLCTNSTNSTAGNLIHRVTFD